MKGIVGQFADWVRTKRGPYDYARATHCAFATYLRESGIAANPLVTPSWWQDGMDATSRHPLPEGLNMLVMGGPPFDQTYEALAERLEKAGY